MLLDTCTVGQGAVTCKLFGLRHVFTGEAAELLVQLMTVLEVIL